MPSKPTCGAAAPEFEKMNAENSCRKVRTTQFIDALLRSGSGDLHKRQGSANAKIAVAAQFQPNSEATPKMIY